MRTKSLILEPINLIYSKDLFELWSDYDVIKYTYAPQIKTQKECDERIKMFIDKYTDWDCPNNFAVLLDCKAIGIAGFPVINKERFEFGFYYHFIKRCWGKGYASEVARALMEYIYKNYNEAIIYADAVVINPASIKVLTKLGFEQTKLDENGFNKNGLELDLIHFKFEKSKNKGSDVLSSSGFAGQPTSSNNALA